MSTIQHSLSNGILFIKRVKPGRNKQSCDGCPFLSFLFLFLFLSIVHYYNDHGFCNINQSHTTAWLQKVVSSKQTSITGCLSDGMKLITQLQYVTPCIDQTYICLHHGFLEDSTQATAHRCAKQTKVLSIQTQFRCHPLQRFVQYSVNNHWKKRKFL